MNSNTLKNSFVADTMAVVLRLEKRKLSLQVKAIFEQAEQCQAVIYIPALVFAEILYLSERQRIECNLDSVKAYLRQFPSIKEQPLDFAVTEVAGKINDIPELHDRIISATALALDVPILTNDPLITASQFVKAIW